jgi:hypothetical protein
MEKKAGKKPIEGVIKDLEELMTSLKKLSMTPLPVEKLTPELEDKLRQLEADVEQFRIEGQKTLVQAGIEPTELHRIVEQIPEELSEDTKKTLHKLKTLKKEAVEGYERTKEIGRREKKGALGTPKKHPKAARKNKFKQFGGDQEWQRL